MEQINRDLLIDLCEIVHPSGREQEMISYILNYCYRIPGITLFLDEENNLFVTKNTTDPETYPCLVSHTDEILKYTGTKRARIKNNKIYGFYERSGKQCGLGLDDSFGVYVCLHLLNVCPDLKCVFCAKEELGCVGSDIAALNIDYFDNVRFLLQADRMGDSDLITHTNGIDVTSDEFLKDIDHLLEKYHYKEARGTMTDIGALKENVNVSAVNISCGYYHAHTHNEYGDLRALTKCLNFILEIINLNDKVYEHKSDLSYSYGHYSSLAYHYGYDPYEEYDGWALQYNSKKTEEDFYSDLADACEKCTTFDCMRCPHTMR